ncbi:MULTISPECIES: c-type cytochrome [Kordiimonas]|jgi:cytochrome c|uniref:Cytochrome c n=1 Tax=Kordiimonas lacus TaxID=637679 RepID=A0A1G6VVJ1_9PROT|nr:MULTISPECIES: cytochrome c family protein [Kordiimonas]SDD57568.1 cytochrome c [Kordiimonas lacus]
MKKTFATLALVAALSPFVAPATIADDDPTSTAISDGGDATKGKRLFNRCKACHNLTASDRAKLGPNLDNLFGRTAGTSESFTRYSKALTEAGFVWTEEKLDAWLTSPKTFLPGNKMQFAGLRKEQDRKDLMAYLRDATTGAE